MYEQTYQKEGSIPQTYLMETYPNVHILKYRFLGYSTQVTLGHLWKEELDDLPHYLFLGPL